MLLAFGIQELTITRIVVHSFIMFDALDKQIIFSNEDHLDAMSLRPWIG